MSESPTLNPIYLQGGTYSARFDRRNVGNLLDIQGRRNVGDLLVKQRSTPGMGVLIDPGAAWLDAVSDQHAHSRYYITLDTQIDAPIGAMNADPRKDLIVLRVLDQEFGAGTSEAVIQVIQGTPAATPLRPSNPSGSLIQLAEVNVPASGGGSSSITNTNLVDLRPGARINRALLQRALNGMALAGNMSAGGFRITNHAVPVSGTDVANKQYVDDRKQELAYKELTSDTAGVGTTQVTVTALTLSFTLATSRRIQFGFDGNLDTSHADNAATVGATGSKTIARQLKFTSTQVEAISGMRIATFAPGTHTLTFTLQRTGGTTGTIWMKGSNNSPFVTYAIDLGAA
jgi:hypothetical protein